MDGDEQEVGLVKGDIFDDNCHIDIKGSQVRVSSSKIRGVDYRDIVEKTFSSSKIEPNKIKGKGILSGQTAYEIEKNCHSQHYQEQFKKLSLQQGTDLINLYLDSLEIEEKPENLTEFIFPNGLFNNKNLAKILIKD